MPASTAFDPCAQEHTACGCVPLGRRCCLECPLATCLLDSYQGHLVAKSRGARIAELKSQGVEPTAIRQLLGISRVQYHRAVQTLAAPVALLDDATPAEQDRAIATPFTSAKIRDLTMQN